MNDANCLARIRLIASAAMVSRFHTMPLIRSESVGEHSWVVAMLADWMSDGMDMEARYRIMRGAILHDIAEAGVGDIPSPVKRKFDCETADAVKDLELKVLEDAGYSEQTLWPQEYRVQKLADIFAGMLKCRIEMQMGNSLMRIPFQKYRSYVDASFNPLTEKEREVYVFLHAEDLTYYAGENT